MLAFAVTTPANRSKAAIYQTRRKQPPFANSGRFPVQRLPYNFHLQKFRKNSQQLNFLTVPWPLDKKQT
jgi:hypothetical protein